MLSLPSLPSLPLAATAGDCLVPTTGGCSRQVPSHHALAGQLSANRGAKQTARGRSPQEVDWCDQARLSLFHHLVKPKLAVLPVLHPDKYFGDWGALGYT